MSRYNNSLTHQAAIILKGKLAIGTPRHGIDKAKDDKIHSITTYKNYKKILKQFIKWLRINHPDASSINKAVKYTPEWLSSLEAAGLSAWSVKTYRAAINKFYGIKPGDEYYYVTAVRQRSAIKRSRHTDTTSRSKNDERNSITDFCKATGLRRRELEALKGSDLYDFDELEALRLRSDDPKDIAALANAMAIGHKGSFVLVKSGKGGKRRYAPVIGNNSEEVIQKIKSTPGDKKVWGRVSKSIDIHALRAQYSADLYKAIARDVSTIQKKDKYFCRKELAGVVLDKNAMKKVSLALGHNRINIIAYSYAYKFNIISDKARRSI